MKLCLGHQLKQDIAWEGSADVIPEVHKQLAPVVCIVICHCLCIPVQQMDFQMLCPLDFKCVILSDLHYFIGIYCVQPF
jgi:hypothetical protein